MTTANDALALVRSINQTAAFNRSFGIEVLSAEPGKVEIGMPWREEAGQYSGFLPYAAWSVPSSTPPADSRR